MEIPGYTYLTHKIIPRPWGIECRFTMARADGTHINDIVMVPSADISDSDLTALVAAYLGRLEAKEAREALFSHVFDNAGTEVKEAIGWLIKNIRQYPNATLAQAETAWNNAWADSLFTFSKLVNHVQRVAGGVTWANFKTYVINHLFEGID